MALPPRLPEPARSRGVRADYVAHLGFAPHDRCQRGSRFVPGNAICFRVGDSLPRRGLPCTALASGQRMVRRVLCGSGRRQPGPAAEWCTGVPRPAGGRGGCDCAGRSIRRAFPGSAASGITCGLPELAVSLGSSVCGPDTPHRNLVQRHAGARSGGDEPNSADPIALQPAPKGTVHVHAHLIR